MKLFPCVLYAFIHDKIHSLHLQKSARCHTCRDRHNLENMPVYDRPPRVIDHLAPVLRLAALPGVAQHGAADRVTRPDTVIVAHGHLQVHALVQCDAIRWDSFYGDVVMDSIIVAYRDGDSILEQIYKKNKKKHTNIFGLLL